MRKAWAGLSRLLENAYNRQELRAVLSTLFPGVLDEPSDAAAVGGKGEGGTSDHTFV